MPYGYLGTTPNQQYANSGVFSIEEALALQNEGELGGSFIKVAEVDTTGLQSIMLTDIQETRFNTHLLVHTSGPHATGSDTEHFSIRFSDNNGTDTESNSNYSQAKWYQWSSTATAQVDTGGNSFAYINAYSNQDYQGGGFFYFYNLGKADKHSMITFHSVGGISATDVQYRIGGGQYKVEEAHNAIEIQKSNYSEQYMGKFSLYGLKE